ncbi:MAG: hypothetical protein J5905_02320 [Prevotella sp.]|nr:hypothetical protein [Prevotella sp.]
MKRYCLPGVLSLLLMLVTIATKASVTIDKQGGWFESAYVEFIPDGSSYYNVYYSTDQSNWTKIDDQLVRKYGSSKGRADVLGIKAGTYYIKVASVNASGTETANVVSNPLIVKAHDRGGFAHFNNANKVGAYKDDGTLKSGANILYITKSNAKTITMTVPSAANKTAIYTGLQTIINAWTKAYSNNWSSAPLDIRVLGTLSADDMDTFSSSAEGIQIKGASGYADCPITLEGVGNDAVIHGFGFLIRNMQNLELRNFAIMNCMDDAVSIDSNNSHIWVHNLDLFYGNAGSDKDQVKGDGTVDMKGDSRYITVSYNHFWDTGKSSLCGMKSETGPNYITYHHNWFDHSDSRHPRIRTMSVHVYNNYFDGVSKYGSGVTTSASCFVDRNYFRSCKYPMLSSLQGSDVYAGTTTRNPDSNGTFSGENSGVIKSYGNVITGNCTYIPYGASTYLLHGTSTAIGNIDSTVDFDAYEVSSPSQTVPSTVKGYAGGSTYNNFDQNIYSYTADDAADVPSVVKGAYGAGRMQQGSYQYTFTEADDSDYGVIASLKSDVAGYKSTSYYTPVTNSMYFKDGVITDSAVEGEGGGGEEEEPTPTTSDDATLKSLNVSGYSLSFSSNTTYYAVTLKYGTETAPTVSATANSSNATVTITQATSPTGKATVKVTAEDGTTIKLYEVQFSVAAEPAPSGSSISSAMTLNMTDDGYTSYITGTYTTSTSKGSATYGGVTGTGCIKMESKTSLSFTTTKAFTMTFVAASTETANFKLDGTTVAASSGNTVSVDVATGTHEITKGTTINLFFLDFAEVEGEEPEPELSSDATLSALSVEGYSLTPTFSPSTYTYSVELAAGTTTLPNITATTNDANATAEVDNEACQPAGQAVIDVEAEDGTLGKYYINFTVAPTYYNVSASAGAGGSASVSPSGSVAEGTSVTFTATPNSGYVFSKWSDNSTENPHTVTITGDLTLTAQFAVSSSGDKTYKNIKAESSNPYIFTDLTSTGLADSWITVTGVDSYNTAGTRMYIDPSTDVNNNSSSKTAVTAAQVKSTKYLTFHVTNASKVTVYGYHTNSTASRNLVVSDGTNSNQIAIGAGSAYSCSLNLSGANTDLKVATDEGSGVFVYAIKFEPSAGTSASSDATLSDLTVNGTTISGFNASTTVYNVSLPYGTTIVPTVAASKNDNGASVSITQASSTTGSASVVVTAEDGTTVKTYTVNFSVSTSLVLTDAANYVAGTFAAGDVTYTRATVDGNYGSFCLPFDFNTNDVEGIVKIYVPVNIAVYNTTTNKLRLFLALQSGTVAAGTPFIALFNGATSVTNSAEVTLSSTMGNPSPIVLDVFNSNGSDGALLENEDLTVTWNGTYVSTAKVDGMMSFNRYGDFNYHGSSTLGAFRAYLVLSSSVNSNSIEVEWLAADDATAINAIKQNINSNGDVMYNLNGQMVNSSAAKGIYIKNGVKVIR